MKILRFLLLPITMFFSYLIAFYSFYFGVQAIFWLVNLSWLWLIIGFTFLIGLIGMLTQLPKYISQWVFDYLYNNHWLAIICHSFAGLAGFILAAHFYFENPIVYTTEKDVLLEGLAGMWAYSKIRTILFTVLVLQLILSTLFMVVQPIFDKLKTTKE